MPFQLMNVETAAAEHPATFKIAPRETRGALRAGELAKLIFDPVDDAGALTGNAERMWVRIETVDGERYTGELRNEPFGGDLGLRIGDRIEFGPEHIADWRDQDGQ